MAFVLGACTSALVGPYSFTYTPVQAGKFEIATWQLLTNASEPVHIYIEGDGYAFDKHGKPTRNPTPRQFLMRNLAGKDSGANVVYVGRPCQYVQNDNCDVTDWTSGRFSKDGVDSMYLAVKNVAKGRPVVLIGYSGGAMVSGLLIQRHPDLNVKKWITIAGVLNHKDWTKYFDDAPLDKSLNMTKLPDVSQVHYIARGDKVVPNKLSYKWIPKSKIVVVENAKHNRFPNIDLNFK